MNRRDLLKSTASISAFGITGAVIVAATSCAPIEAPAAEPDPTFAAIEAHKAAWANWTALDDTDDPSWPALCRAETDAFEAVCEVVPTTLAGVVAMSGYIGRFCLTDLPPDGDCLHQAFLTIAQAVARVDYFDGRA